jgi:hypothetical protein
MTAPQWENLTLARPSIPANPEGLWTPVLEYIEGAVKLRITATGLWSYLPNTNCGPDGYRAGGLADDALSTRAPLGALIGKIGGSTADIPDAEKDIVFVVGSFCVVTLTAEQRGPLFMTMNDRVAWFAHHTGELRISIFEAR